MKKVKSDEELARTETGRVKININDLLIKPKRPTKKYCFICGAIMLFNSGSGKWECQQCQHTELEE